MWIHNIKLGSLDQRIVLKDYESEIDLYGGEVITWTTLDTVWANVTANHGNEDEESTQETEKFTYTFTIRYRDDLTGKNRIEFDGSEYDILAVNFIGRKFYTVIKAIRRE